MSTLPSMSWSRYACQNPVGTLRAGPEAAGTRAVAGKRALCSQRALYAALRAILPQPARPVPCSLSPNPPNGGGGGLAEREIRDMEERLSGRFWTVGVSGRSAVVVSSRSPRDRTQQKTLTGRSGASLGDVGVELVGEVGGPVADGRCQAGSGMARSRARARLNWVSQGQRLGRCRVRRRAERVSRPAREKNRRRRVLVVTSCSPRPMRAAQRARLWASTPYRVRAGSAPPARRRWRRNDPTGDGSTRHRT